MKRLHVHVAVADLDASVRFYSALFAAEPTVLKPDYAKWMLEDPRVNFAISARGGAAIGLDHLGIQAEDEAELAEVYSRLEAADTPVLEQGDVTCCYANSEKSWIIDPSGIAWEAFLTHGTSTVYGDGSLRLSAETADLPPSGACCGAPAVPGEEPAPVATACCGTSAAERAPLATACGCNSSAAA